LAVVKSGTVRLGRMALLLGEWDGEGAAANKQYRKGAVASLKGNKKGEFRAEGPTGLWDVGEVGC